MSTMNKVLLIGEFGDVVRSLNECLEGDYQVQLCSEQIDMIKGMTKISKPDLIMVCQIGIDETDRVIFSWVKEEHPDIPVIVITTRDGWRQIRDLCQGNQFAIMFRPVTKQGILNMCSSLLQGASPKTDFPEMGRPSRKKKDRYKIMVVDDSPLVLRNTKTMLEDQYEVFLAPSGEKALELIPKRCPDVLLLDYEMPGMDGKQVYEIMLQDPYMKTIPVIFLTSIADKNSVYRVLESQPEGYILKPADSERLLDEIKKVLS